MTNLHFLDNNALGVRGSSEGVALEGGSQVLLLVPLVGPSLVATVHAQLTCAADSTGFTAQTGIKTAAGDQQYKHDIMLRRQGKQLVR